MDGGLLRRGAPPLHLLCTSSAPPLHLLCTSSAPPLHLLCSSSTPPLRLLYPPPLLHLLASSAIPSAAPCLHPLQATLGEQFPRLDKKREKAVQQSCRAAWREQLQVEVQPAVLLQLSLLLLHLELSSATLFPVPLKLLPTLVDLLQPKLSAGAHATLTRFATLTQAALGAELPADQQAAAEELAPMLEEVRQLGLAKGRD